MTLTPIPRRFSPAKIFLLLAILNIILLLPSSVVFSGEVTLAWDESTHPDLAGYRLYLGIASGIYQSSIDVGKNTTWTVGNLDEGETYYIAATAYDASGMESSFSNQVEVNLQPAISITSRFVLGINCGGPQYLGQDGTQYQADSYYDGGRTYQSRMPVSGTNDSFIYQSERFGSFSYKIPVANGRYSVTLKFAEIYPYAWSGSRLFDVSIQGNNVLRNLDVYTTTAGRNKAFDATFPANVADGMLTIYFRDISENAAVNGILIKAD